MARGTENKIEHNSLNFRATDSRFCMEVRMDSPNQMTKYKSTKYKSTKIQKYKVQNKKVQKYKNAKKCKKYKKC